MAATQAQRLSASSAASTVDLSPITAEFVQADRATHYSVTATGAPGATLRYAWFLELKLVDPAGSSPADDPTAHAAVDEGCDNEPLPGGQLFTKDTVVWTSLGANFTWHHGEVGSYPGSEYGCHHALQGPSGHQGVVMVTVGDGKWACTASYEGTNSGKGFFSDCFQARATGTVTRQNGRLVLTVTNTGDVPIDTLRFEPPNGVQIRDIQGSGTIEVIPGGRGFSWGAGQPLKPGESVTFSFVTDDAYPPDEGSLIVTSDGETEFNGTLKGPTPHAPPPPDKKKPACKCSGLAVSIDPTLLNKRIPPDAHDFGVGLTWTMSCTGGRGSCLGFLHFSPPQVLAGSLPKPPGNLKLSLDRLTVTCHSPCGKANRGRFEIKLRSRDQLNQLFGRTLAFTVRRECGGKSAVKPELVEVFIDRRGYLRPPGSGR